MAIEKVQVFKVVCDICGYTFPDLDVPYYMDPFPRLFTSEDAALRVMRDVGWDCLYNIVSCDECEARLKAP